MVCTVALDLTKAILVGLVVSVVLFIKSISELSVTIQQVDPARLKEKGIVDAGTCRHAKVAYLTGPVFFAALQSLDSALHGLGSTHTLILSMRGVPMLDICGVQALERHIERLKGQNCTVLLASVQPQVLKTMERGGLLDRIGQDNIFWSADQAIVAAGQRICDCV